MAASLHLRRSLLFNAKAEAKGRKREESKGIDGENKREEKGTKRGEETKKGQRRK